MNAGSPRLSVRRLSKRFGGVQALSDAGLEVAPGSIHALVGENGAGKSTLIRVLAGAVRADAGTIELDGRAVSIPDAHAARALGIAVVHQELSLVPDLSVAENVLLGRWPAGRFGMVDRARLEREAREILLRLGLDVSPGASVRALSVASRQMIEIARALADAGRLLILDEPSAVLTSHELTRLFQILRGLAAAGVSVVYVSHRLDEVFEIADTVTVLRDGRRVSSRPIAGVTRSRLIAEMVGRELGDSYPPPLAPPGEVVLTVEGLSAAPRFRDVSFEVRAGEVFALSGMVGSGRSSVLGALFGAVPCSGHVRVDGSHGPFGSPRAAIAAGIASLPEDRQRSGLLPERSLRENVSLASLDACSRWGVIRQGEERALAAGTVKTLGVRTASVESEARTLSGGNQQKVLLGRWMTRRFRVLLLDEPTRGVDVGARHDLYTLIRRIAADGTAVVMSSSELPEVIGLADRIGVLCRGRLAGIVDNRMQAARPEELLQLAAGAA